MSGLKFITFASWIYVLNVITVKHGFKLDLKPLNPVVHVGEDLELICRAISCPVNVTFKWRALLDRFHGGDVQNEPADSRLLIRNISVKHNNDVVCTASCENESKEKMSKIRVFSFPQDPVLPKIKNLIANQEQNLTCTIHNIYPVEKLHIQWILGDKHLDHMVEPDMPYDQVQNYSSLLSYIPSADDVGKNISCEATLNLENDWEKKRSSTVEYGPGTMTVSSNNTLVKPGEHLEIVCHADGNPKPTITWWKLEETELAPQSQNGKLIINNASWSQAGWYQCNASNVVGSLHTRVKVSVLGPPNIPQIKLSHSGDPEEGENITLFCSSDGGPAELRLYRQSQSAATEGLSKSAALLNIPSIQITDAGIYVCEAKNGYGTEKSTINIKVKAQHSVSKMPDLPVALLPTVGSVSLLTIAGLLIRYFRKKAKANNSSNLALN